MIGVLIGAVIVAVFLIGEAKWIGFDVDAIQRLTIKLGVFGPAMIVGLMVLAIVVSPVPSGPIAMAAGALYGTTLGAVLSITGATIGASIAFGLARRLGRDAVRRSDNKILTYLSEPRSDAALMMVVFLSRLLPFISFDAVSYAAGVTVLGFWRFALATLAGVVPVSFALAAMGAGIATSNRDWTVLVVLCGGITLVPVIGRWLWVRLKR